MAIEDALLNTLRVALRAARGVRDPEALDAPFGEPDRDVLNILHVLVRARKICPLTGALLGLGTDDEVATAAGRLGIAFGPALLKEFRAMEFALMAALAAWAGK